VGEQICPIECQPYNADAFVAALERIRGLTRLSPEEWGPQVEPLCAEAGVAVVVVDSFKKSRANGATRWLSPTKALIQLSLRGRWEDIFWFTFFHEAGHVHLHRKKEIFLDADPGKAGGSVEDEANRFAARMLIPPRYGWQLPLLRLGDIPSFAEQIGVAPAIVVGRLHHEGHLPFSRGNHLRKRFKMSD
jgi:HTH-type transcriptional regulator/antitoxin HigA